MPIWAVVIALLIALIFVIPVGRLLYFDVVYFRPYIFLGMIQAVTTRQVGLKYVSN